jgi:hypothetical protein
VGGLVGVAACSGSTKSTGTSGGGGGGSASDPTGALDGTWDITTAGTGNIGPSQMTAQAGTVTGAIVDEYEGQPDPGMPSCTYSAYRVEFTFNVQGNALNATFNNKREYSSPSCPKPDDSSSTLTCTRTRVAAASDTDMNGDWDCTAQDNPTFTVTVDGLAAQGWDKTDKAAGKPASVSVAIANGVATVSATNSDFKFAAKKR